ncbi:MAG: ATP-binding protein [bacterium]|nr:ATP-binding protein [bacterium]
MIQPEIPAIGCAQCDGYGNIITPTGVKDCECKLRAQIAFNLLAAQIPPMYARKSLENFKPSSKYRKEVLETAKGFFAEYKLEGKGLLFMGPCGTGKTHVAVAILIELILAGHTGLFYNIISLLDDLRASYNSKDESEQWELIDRVRDTKILILDDLGAEKTSGWVNDRLYAIINYRYENKKTTIVTSNKSESELKDQVGYRIYSRLVEMCRVIPFEGKDYRIEMMKSGEA